MEKEKEIFQKFLSKQLGDLVDAELIIANEKFDEFHSMHEGYAVIKEELEEAIYEISLACKYNDKVWNEIKENATMYKVLKSIEMIELTAIKAIIELIQVSAMTRKFKNLNKENKI